jgi:hypothetical protein
LLQLLGSRFSFDQRHSFDNVMTLFLLIGLQLASRLILRRAVIGFNMAAGIFRNDFWLLAPVLLGMTGKAV